MENTFTHDVTFLTKVLQDDDVTWKNEDIKKTATFDELNRAAESQHLLHFLIASIMEYKPGEGGGEDKFFIPYDKMYDLSKMAVKTLLKVGNGITEADKTQILADSYALLNFGDWFATNKALPFFIQRRTILIK